MAWEDDVDDADEPDGIIHIYPKAHDEPEHILVGSSCWCDPEVQPNMILHRRTQ